MFIGFSDINLSVVIPSGNILKLSKFGSRISIYYYDVSAFTNEKYVEEIHLEYDSEEKANKNWKEFFDALKSGENVFFFDSDVE